MQYILIETEPTFTTRAVTVLVTTQAAALSTSQVSAFSTSQVSALGPTTLTQIVTDVKPGTYLFQCISQTGAVGYKTLDGQPFNLVGGSGVVDPNPPTPVWDVPEAPYVYAPEPGSRVITKLDYMNRFRDEELAALYSAAKTVVQIEVWWEKFKVSDEIDLSDPRIGAGLHALESAGLIGPGRANEILA